MGRLTSIDRAFTDETRTYDSANRLLTIDNTSVGQATYTWDANSNKLSETWTGNMAAWSFTTEKSGGTFTDGYDAEDRFRRFIQSSQSNDIYLARSDIGNISDVEINSVSNLRSYSNVHELTTVDGTSQTFDDDGNLTLNHHDITVNWDDANRLTQTVVPPTATAGIEGTNDYGYDADGKRVFKKITRSGAVAEHTVYIYAGPNCIAEYNSGALAASPEQEYVYADGIDSLVLLSRNSDADRYVATRNQQWSITALADISNGTVQERYTYDPFGKRTILAPDGSTLRTASSYNMPYGYTSRRHDAESALMYFRARYYDTSTGEFTSRDPLEYVDGMSMMRGYMELTGLDPNGKNSNRVKRYCAVASGPTYSPSGTIGPDIGPGGWTVRWYNNSLSESTLRASFTLNASFFDDRDSGRCDKVYDCRCCEVRQFIKWDELFEETWGGPPHGGFADKDPGTWYEDRAERKRSLITGRWKKWRYGHRRDRVTEGYFDDFGNPDRWGCNFKDSDHPGGAYDQVIAVGGSWYFKLTVVDTCNGGITVKEGDVLRVIWPGGV